MHLYPKLMNNKNFNYPSNDGYLDFHSNVSSLSCKKNYWHHIAKKTRKLLICQRLNKGFATELNEIVCLLFSVLIYIEFNLFFVASIRTLSMKGMNFDGFINWSICQWNSNVAHWANIFLYMSEKDDRKVRKYNFINILI